MKAAVALININHDVNRVALVRTAEHFGIKRVFVVGRLPKSWKCAMNCHKNMLLRRFDTIKNFLDYLDDQGYNLCVAEQTTKSRKLHKVRFPRNPCFVTGHEVLGVPQEILDKAECVVEIPNVGLVNCLNTATSGALMIYKWFERRVLS